MTKENFLAQVAALIEKAKETARVIATDYINSDGQIVEIEAVFDTLKGDFEEIFDVTEDDLELEKVLDYLDKHDLDEAETITVLDKLNSEYKKEESILIRLDSMTGRSKLEDFLRSEIYPFPRDYNDNVTNL